MGRATKSQPEQDVNLLRHIEVVVVNGESAPLACKEAGLTEQSYYRWPMEYRQDREDF